ncbi:C-terminal binding protein [Marinobacterium sedimentorum]|uniref:C-terminal binding protein n=1 Tax=Marinobacterium sedimentorum TaxID=2927804 RepID=UPI0020C60F9B|nr:C-terminal binding protein [Marinobacterium sedimentorum]MCP8689506.1 C-terminal binding protein [Marinobacterium sedimentorum]
MESSSSGYKFKVYISDYDYPDLEIERSILEPIGAQVIGLQCKSGEGLGDLAYDADAILQQYAKIDRDTISKLKSCKVICRYGIGTDILDLKACKEFGVAVSNVPDYCLDEVADHSIALGFTLLRKVPMYNTAAASGNWHWNIGCVLPKRFRSCVWGLVGFGRISQNIARKLQAFGFKVITFDPYVSKSLAGTFGVEKVTLHELLETSDVVNLMCPHTPETDRLIGQEELQLMKNDSILINGARGKLIDNKALFDALSSGGIFAAGLDDPEEEPAKLDNWSPDQNPLFGLDNCLITPHVAYVSSEAFSECRRVAAENAKAVLLGNNPINPVN